MEGIHLGKILVVDDEEIITGVTEVVLSEAGYQVEVANSGMGALKILETSVPDLIIMDVNMPDLNGYQVTEQIKNSPKLAQIPVIFLSGKPASEDGGRAFEAGAVSYIKKPFSNKQLCDIVELAMQSTARTTAV